MALVPANSSRHSGSEGDEPSPPVAAPPRVAAPAVFSTRPSVANNLPMEGWHRSVVLAGAVMTPHDAAVLYWPPDERTQPLRSKVEVHNWLVTHGMGVAAIEAFSFSVDDCLADLPPADGGPPPVGELPPTEASAFGAHPAGAARYASRDFWVEACAGYPIRRFFDFEGEAAFRQRHAQYLGQFRRSVQNELVEVVAGLAAARREEDARRGALAGGKLLLGGEGANPLPVYEPEDPALFGLQRGFLSDECVNLLHVATSCRSAAELCESPHLVNVAQTPGGGGGGGGCFRFRLFTPAFCGRLAAELGRFEASCQDKGVEMGRPKASDGVVFRRGVLLDELGLSPGFTDVLLATVLRPLARFLFPHNGGGSLDHHCAFAVRQAPNGAGPRGGPMKRGGGGGGGMRGGRGGGDTDGPFELTMDNSEVSLQVCLSGTAAKGDLVLYGPREAPRRGGFLRVPLSRPDDPAFAAAAAAAAASATSREEGAAAAAAAAPHLGQVGPGAGGVGEAVLYAGDELHRWDPLDPVNAGVSGYQERVVLVVWARSSTWRREYGVCDDLKPVRDSSYIYA